MKNIQTTPENLRYTDTSKSFFNKDASLSFFKPKISDQSFFDNLPIQPKLEVGQVGDAYELEAEVTADKVIGILGEINSSPKIQRKCAKCDEDEGHSIQRSALSIRRKSNSLNRVEAPHKDVGNVNQGIESTLANAKGKGDKLPKGVKNEMELAFGTDFNNIRVHTDAQAIQMNRQLGANAFAYGSDIFFNAGNFDPNSRNGKHLLAHELTHTIQQTGLIQRSFGGDPSAECSSVIASSSCASGEECAIPDPYMNRSHLGSNILKINIDIERESFEDALGDTALGHAYVEMIDSSGVVYTYGFYPEAAVPNENVRNVPGCIHHPDITHQNCLEDTVTFELTDEQFQLALGRAQQICRNRHTYGQSYTCTSFANQVASAAGQSLPSSASRPIIVNHTLNIVVPSIENPNSLLDSLRRLGPPPRNIYNIQRYSLNQAAQEVVNRYLYVVQQLAEREEITEEVQFLVQEFRVIAQINADLSNVESTREFEQALLNDGRIDQSQLQQIMSIINGTTN